MIEFIFTIDYEIYGNGEGSLKEHVYKPAYRLQKMFNQTGNKLVYFVEAAELERIEAAKSDPAITDVKRQIRDLYCEGHEIALHVHPQWYNGSYKNGKWELDNSEYNLCVLPEQRIAEIVDQSVNYLCSILSDPHYTPLSFRAGNWLFQPTGNLAKRLIEHGIKIDSSVFKGGLQHQHGLDYRSAVKNGYFWKFQDDVNKPDVGGKMMEIPIHTQMVPPWKMATKKRLGLQQKAVAGRIITKEIIYRLLDMARLWQPLKLDFCRMTIEELTTMMDNIINDDRHDPQTFKPIVAIGHTKDLVDLHTVDLFLTYLAQKRIKVSTFEEVYSKSINNYH